MKTRRQPDRRPGAVARRMVDGIGLVGPGSLPLFEEEKERLIRRIAGKLREAFNAGRLYQGRLGADERAACVAWVEANLSDNWAARLVGARAASDKRGGA